MSGFGTNQTSYLTRTSLWSTQLKDVLEAELMGTRWVRMISEFGDGDTLNIPSIGQAQVYDYAEGQPAKYSNFDTGNFQFSITEYKQTGVYIYDKFKQDSFYANEVESMFVPKMSRAIMTSLEEDILAAPTPGAISGGQTSTSSNTINGAKHRFVGSGTNETMTIEDFQRAAYALKKANVPATNLMAIVDPSVEYELGRIPNLINFSNNPRWEGVVESGLSSGMKFVKNIWGFDVYVSQFLYTNTGSEAIDGLTAAAGVNNLFFSATPDLMPIIGQIRQPPRVESERNKDYQRDEFLITARWGLKLFRPENMVCVVTDTDQIYV